MELGLRGRSALVTGASKGIGRAVAEGLAEEGVDLHLTARSADLLDKAAAELRERHGVKVATHVLDLGESGGAAKLAQAVGTVDILVNNAGAIPTGDLQQMTEDRWRHAWELKVFGYINLAREMYLRMREQRRGVIVNVTGIAGLMPQAGYIAGSVGNAGLNTFGAALGGPALDDGIRVLNVAPGLIATERLVNMLGNKAEEAYGDRSRWRDRLQGMNLPLGRPGEPREIADVVVFLASDRCSYVSGITVLVDGGFSTRPPAI